MLVRLPTAHKSALLTAQAHQASRYIRGNARQQQAAWDWENALDMHEALLRGFADARLARSTTKQVRLVLCMACLKVYTCHVCALFFETPAHM